MSRGERRAVAGIVAWKELVVFDILTRPAPELSTAERDEVKKVARELLARLKQLLVLDWRQKAASRSQVKLTIEDLLEAGLPQTYSADLFKQKCSAVFEHFYESYQEHGVNVFTTAA